MNHIPPFSDPAPNGRARARSTSLSLPPFSPHTPPALAKTIAATIGVKALIPLNNLFMAAAMARSLTTADFGVLALLGGYNMLCQGLAIFGADVAMSKEIGRRPAEAGAYMGSAYLLCALASIPALFVMNLLILAGRPTRDVALAATVLSLSLLPAALSRCTDAVFIATGRAQHIVATTAAREIVRSVLVMYALMVHSTVFGIAVAMSVAALIGCAVNLFMTARWLPEVTLTADRARLYLLARISLGQVIIAGLSNLFAITGIVVLAKMGNDEAAGVFSAAQKCLIPLFFVVDGLGTVLLPVLARTFDDGNNRRSEMLGLVARLLFVFVALYTTLGFFYAEPMVRLIFGPGWAPSAALLRVVIWTVPCTSTAYVLGRLLLVSQAQRYDAIALLLAITVQVVAGILLTPRWGATGMAVAAVLANIVLAAAMALFVSRVGLRLRVAVTGRVIAASAALFLLLLIMEPVAWFTLPLAAGAGLALQMWVGGIRSSDLAKLRFAGMYDQ